MKPLGRGRIVLWEGASLWTFEVPPGASAWHSTEAHAHHAIQLTFSLGGRFAFRIGGDVVDGPGVLIAPDVSHAYLAEGRNAIVLVEPESRPGAALRCALAGRDFARQDCGGLADLASRLSSVWEGPRPDDATLVGLGKSIVARLAEPDAGPQAIDARITRVLDRLSAEPDLRMTAASAAALACLSDSRFSHLFVEQVGLPFRTYVLWRRLTVAVAGIAAGASLTSAAHEAGFADSAHFSRTFLRMFGVPASLLLTV